MTNNTLNLMMLHAARTYGIKKDIYGLERGLTAEQKAQEKEEQEKGRKAQGLLDNFQNVEQGLYTWKNNNWVLEE
jgi:hypothetical protein